MKNTIKKGEFGHVKRDTFIIYRSFYESMTPLEDSLKLKLYEAICEFSLNGEDIELEGVAASLFMLMRPILEANNKRYLNGKSSKTIGSAKQTRSKAEGSAKQTRSKMLTNKDKDKDKDKDKNQIGLPFSSDKFRKVWSDWKEYKNTEHKFKYKSPISEQGALTGLVRLAGNGGEKECIAIIEHSIENGWKGFFKLDKGATSTHPEIVKF